MPKERHVAVIVDATKPYDRKVISGLAEYVQQVGNWSLYVEEEPLDKLPDFRSWSGDGVIANFDDQRVFNAVRNLDVPVVGLGGGYGQYHPDMDICYLRTDNQKISQLAATLLIDRGFRNFAYCGMPKTPLNGWSKERENSFTRYLSSRSYPCEIYNGRFTTTRQWRKLQNHLGSWLQKVQKPIGIMACNDARARHVLEACRNVGLSVPDEVAVIGVDNDELICELTQPPLSSIEQGAKHLGYEAAANLDKLMSSKRFKAFERTIEPVGVVERGSTDTLAFDDDAVTLALQIIRKRACDSIQVRDVIDAVMISRTSLETRFQKHTGRSIHSEIRRTQLSQAKKMLTAGNLPIKSVSQHCGFRTVQYFTTVFREEYGETPAAFQNARRSVM
ncbi:MAG: DNA-binding transcriptional regulator [Verrucomicrobiota bacterium]